MELLWRSTFGQLFMTTFVVAATFQGAAAMLGIVFALLSPGIFNMNGAPATNSAQALGVVLFLTTFLLALNAGISALGALVWLAVRRAFPKGRAAVGADAS